MSLPCRQRKGRWSSRRVRSFRRNRCRWRTSRIDYPDKVASVLGIPGQYYRFRERPGRTRQQAHQGGAHPIPSHRPCWSLLLPLERRCRRLPRPQSQGRRRRSLRQQRWRCCRRSRPHQRPRSHYQCRCRQRPLWHSEHRHYSRRPCRPCPHPSLCDQEGPDHRPVDSNQLRHARPAHQLHPPGTQAYRPRHCQQLVPLAYRFPKPPQRRTRTNIQPGNGLASCI
jgi:hypothetical protein